MNVQRRDVQIVNLMELKFHVQIFVIKILLKIVRIVNKIPLASKMFVMNVKMNISQSQGYVKVVKHIARVARLKFNA